MAQNQPTIPHNREAEEALIGAAIVDPRVIPEASTLVTPGDFYIVRNGWIWEGIVALHNARKTIDYITLVEELERSKRLGEVGGEGYVMSMISNAGSSLGAMEYARIVKTESVRRKTLEAASKMADGAYNAASIDEVLAIVERETSGVRTSVSITDTRTALQAVVDTYEQAEDAARNERPPTIPTGFYDLDRYCLKGLRNGRFYIVATRPGVGKSAFLIDLVRHASIVREKHALINSLEMSGEEVAGRVLAGQYEISSENIEMGMLKEEEWKRMTDGLSDAQKWKFHVDDTPGITIESIAARAESMQLRTGLDLLVVDYIQLVKCQAGWGDNRMRSRQQELGYVSRTMKEIARKLSIPVVAAAQVNRMSEQRTDFRIRMSDLREAGDLEQDADCVILIQPPGDEQPKDRPMVEFEVAKHRGGRTGSVKLLFVPSMPSFRNPVAEHDMRDWWK